MAFCAAGKALDMPFEGSFNVWISQDLHQRAALYAEEHDLKLNAVVQLALKEYWRSEALGA
jgi:predicted HicB family RNase H-like nuclease